MDDRSTAADVKATLLTRTLTSKIPSKTSHCMEFMIEGLFSVGEVERFASSLPRVCFFSHRSRNL